MQKIILCVCAFALPLAFFVVSSMTYRDAVKRDQHYCTMVERGAWPNYKNRDCEE